MLLKLLEETAKDFVSKIIPPKQRYFTYFFIVVGILWLGGANYYYYAEECAKFKGSLITGTIFFALASITALWEYYMKKNKAANVETSALAIKVLPIVLPIIYNLFTRIILKPQMLKTLAIVGFIGTSLYYTFRSHRNRFDS
jgi:hypothetical protein